VPLVSWQLTRSQLPTEIDPGSGFLFDQLFAATGKGTGPSIGATGALVTRSFNILAFCDHLQLKTAVLASENISLFHIAATQHSISSFLCLKRIIAIECFKY